MKYIFILIIFFSILSCDTVSEKNWHTSPTQPQRLSNFYPFIWWNNIEKIKTGMTVKEVNSIFGYVQYKDHPINAVYYSVIDFEKIKEIALKLDLNRRVIKGISVKDYIPYRMEKKNFKLFSQYKVNNKTIYSYKSLKKYTVYDGGLKWQEEAGFFIDYEKHLVSIGRKYQYEQFVILDIKKYKNTISLKIQSTDIYLKGGKTIPHKVLMIKFNNKTKISITGHHFDGVYTPGSPKMYQ